ncbi:AraC-like DNA-binding protein/mannose-6-phosphate isomerase-like protein (cupin superfamily) [Clostridium saccharoperbutylacetonicum]|uniref:Transcriptional regulator with cupin sensor, AraC family n=1 Tax=Clostridium saccharoperbutylacetonicum N1-4(HMT) TaxID=931276 RepID=M1MI25_9CLOT|nr:AraC family transcriptional regulator [Clostridium saccharoperbutylacetonicum]AGF57579.1 transcriptional regulator with cupin sensor, AraC family [Clostridium saccharoperbutylacetonicum N1-4(HMT)]NRT61653.1 AraC-like DNA-binding protein/mannose-6-phosphate isomerase-like protein (cupin superfamily) [Clostridium saccharoperbutylacetonicum]NSB24976.1 AraC-like DNA-binding protein/mannose-6-phosphate isomerase-like protein (cupin superfamily) [Clostridium saccharoperbutylacetonicum]NSB44347.1 A
MLKEIHDKLIALTEEESQILNGEASVNKSLYTDEWNFVIDSNKLLPAGELIDIRKHTRFVNFPSHKHNYIEFNYVYQGKLIQIIDNKEIILQKGELIFLNQYITHEIKASNEDDIIINFIIRPEFFDYIITLLDNENIISKFLLTTLYTDYEEGEYLYFKVSERENIQDLIEKIIIELYEPSIMSKATIKLLVGLLIVELIKNSQDIEIYSVDNYEKMLIIQSLKYIDEYYDTATLSEIAENLKQPDYKLSKLIKKHTGMTFKELLQERKLSKAVELIKSTNYSIVDLIGIIGYENPTYFYKIFKEKFGMTPREYKLKLCDNIDIQSEN